LFLKSIRRYLLILAGLLSLALGVVGILIPLLPTTPFLLLSAYCFIRSSDRLYQWLIHHRIFGNYIYLYMKHRSVKKSAKIGALLLLWPSLFISMIIVNRVSVTIILVIIGSLVTLHILSLKTYQEPKSPL
jgi:uncharacterized protein